MADQSRARLIVLAAVLFGVAPFGFGAMRAMSRAHDFRMLWMAVSSGVGALTVLAVMRRASATRRAMVARAGAMLVTSMLCAAGTAYYLGARAWFGVWAVALVLSACLTVSAALSVRARGTRLRSS